jgi:MtN3 and saliva related transmembrane protein
MDSTELLGLLAGAITSIGFIPQLIRGYRTKKLEDVSYFMPVVLTIGMALWFTYGFLKESLSILAANAFGMGCCIVLLILKKRYS